MPGDPMLLLAPMLSPDAWLYVLIGVALGVLFGSLPGFTATMGLAVLTPFTFWVAPDQAMAMLLGLLVSAIFSGGVPAILLNTPGTPASIAMTWDGHPLARQGRAGLALGLNAIGAFLGIFLSLVVLLLAALPLSRLALRFGPAEYFAVAVFGLSTIVGVSGGSMLKGLATGVIGLLLAVIGLDAITGYPRFTFGQPELLDGVSFIPVMVGLFGIAEVFTQMASPPRQQLDGDTQTSGMLPTREEARTLWAHGLRGSLMGIWIGIMPAAGADVGAILAWDQSRRFSKTPEKFGKGSLEGLIAATTGANAGIGGSLVTTLALGIPGDSAAAVLIGALLMHGLQPGPLLFRNRPDLVATIVALVFMASLVTLVWGLIGARILGKILKIRDQYLWATVLAVALGGSYALNQSTGDVWTAVTAGIFGFLLRQQGFPMGPLVLALILGPMAESNLRRALALSEGSLATFVTRPISLLFLVLAALTLLWPLISRRGHDSRLPDSTMPDSDTL
ncbi:tripartite tricarboxylate transporter permease [Luteitalea sp.]|uniref:tripartite tricarboxylate transporter permease n=1 Tax=Luteitalea sp. TaxID=2004800 RepID=UPI0025B804FC|nr:tripartite tricarboxylate transporter permease [Luteitalea sp.]